MALIICVKCKKTLKFINSDVLLIWDHHDEVSDYTRYSMAEKHQCPSCDYENILIIKGEDLVYKKDIQDHVNRKFEIINIKWDL